MIRKTRADVIREENITSIHESAHVVFAVLGGRRVKWVTIKPKKVILLDGTRAISLGRWDISDKWHASTLTEERKKQHVQTTMAGPVAEAMITGEKNGGQDYGIAVACCDEWGLNIDDMVMDTAWLVDERWEQITRMAELLVEEKTLDENQIQQCIFDS